MKNKMILGLAASSLVASAAMSDMYVGVEYGAASNKKNYKDTYYESIPSFGHYAEETYSGKVNDDYSDIKLKIGAGEDGSVKIQGTISFIDYDKIWFDDTNTEYVEFGLDLIKEFEVNPQFYPFIKGGMGIGSMDVEGYSESYILAISLNLGAGVSYKATKNISLLAGVDYIYRKFQDIERKRSGYYGTTYYTYQDTFETSESAFKPYIGVNFQF